MKGKTIKSIEKISTSQKSLHESEDISYCPSTPESHKLLNATGCDPKTKQQQKTNKKKNTA